MFADALAWAWDVLSTVAVCLLAYWAFCELGVLLGAWRYERMRRRREKADE